MGDRGRPLQVAVMRFREMPGAHEVALIEGLQAIVDSSEDLLQARVFRGSGPLQGDYIALVECRAHDPRIPVTASALGPAADHLDLMTFYIPYWRRGYVPRFSRLSKRAPPAFPPHAAPGAQACTSHTTKGSSCPRPYASAS